MSRKWCLGHAMILVFSAAVWGGQAIAQDDPAQTTDDGLERIDGRFRVLFWRPGTTLQQYKRITILDCFVEFREDWQRDHNRGKHSFNEITAEDMTRIKEILAGEFLEVVTEALEEDGAYEVVDGAANDVLLLRPAILNLDVGEEIYGSRNPLPEMVTAVSMTLYLELYDSTTGTLIGRAIDTRTSPDGGRAAARQILGRWAGNMRDTLEEGVIWAE